MVIPEPVEFRASMRIIIIITPQGLPTGEYGCGNPEVSSCVSLCFFLSWVKHLSFIFPIMVPSSSSSDRHFFFLYLLLH